MASKRFKVFARVSSSNLKAVKPIIDQVIPNTSVREEGSDLVIEGHAVGVSAKELDRSLLSAMRRVEKKTRLRAEWTSDDGPTLRFFDYVLKKTTKTSSSS
jgi:hypothetical protein